MIEPNEIIEPILESYANVLEKDFSAYKNHCYRVLNYMKLQGLTTEELHICTLLLPFHDLGIWTHKTMDYLNPSIELATNYITTSDIQIEENLIKEFIGDHHRLSSNKLGLAEKMRKADFMDLSLGFIKFGQSKTEIKKIKKQFPTHGFQWMVFRKVFSYAITHPWKPFPMMKV